MEARRPRWSSASFLLYAGGLVVLAAAAWGLQATGSRAGDVAFVGWSALVLAVLVSVALAFRRRDEWLAAGVFAVAGVVAAAIFLGSVFAWWGWLGNEGGPFDGFHVGNLVLLLLVLAGARTALLLFAFPLLVGLQALVVWYLVTDLLSNGGGWSAVVTFLVGVAYLVVGSTVDRGPRRAHGFWCHLAAGLLVGGALLYFWHSTAGDWILVALGGLVFVGLGSRLGRSSWTVLGALGLALAAAYVARRWAGIELALFTEGPRQLRPWVPPVVLAALGVVYVALGLAAERRRSE